jgi:hypothetical protein
MFDDPNLTYRRGDEPPVYPDDNMSSDLLLVWENEDGMCESRVGFYDQSEQRWFDGQISAEGVCDEVDQPDFWVTIYYPV